MIIFCACTIGVRAIIEVDASVTAYSLNQNLIDTATPPIPEAANWLSAYQGQHGPALNLAQAVPGDPPPAEFLEHIANAAKSAEATRYGNIFGDGALRAAFATECASVYQAPIAFDEVAITAGCNQAFFVSVLALAAAGDAVLLPAPWYFNHKMTLDMLGIEARPLPLSAEAGFIPDVEHAAALIDDKVKAIVLVTPNNPTGAIYPPGVINAFLDLAHDKNITLIVDETYRDFRVESDAPHGLFSDPRWRDRVISLYSFSKSFAIPGHRLGALIAGAPILEEIGKVLDCIQICPARATQIALPNAITTLGDWRKGITAEINGRAEAFQAAMVQAPDWQVDQIGAYFAYVRHPFSRIAATEVAERLAKDCGLLALPGSYFGPDQDQHLRLAFANVNRKEIERIPERLAALSGSTFATDVQWKDE
ncbi:aminotransferase [Roseibium sp.]|uniref:aminotransferase n=1 Tax=Roseibium sp. TaxID=1936156 RepID=UPI003B51E9EB